MAAATRRPKEPLHRIFYVCSTYTPDEAWSDFLKDCSFGKFPKGVRFENGAIKCTRKRLNFTEYLPKDTEKALQVIIEIFRDRLGIKTDREKKIASDTFEKKKVARAVNSWKDAKTIAAKDGLIRSFVDRFSLYYNLSQSESRQALLLLNLAIATKSLKADRIIMSNCQIVNIEGLKFDCHTRVLSLAGRVPKSTTSGVIDTTPLYYKPVPQINYEDEYRSIVAYHASKM